MESEDVYLFMCVGVIAYLDIFWGYHGIQAFIAFILEDSIPIIYFWFGEMDNKDYGLEYNMLGILCSIAVHNRSVHDLDLDDRHHANLDLDLGLGLADQEIYHDFYHDLYLFLVPCAMRPSA
jgi:hypothetical protein